MNASLINHSIKSFFLLFAFLCFFADISRVQCGKAREGGGEGAEGGWRGGGGCGGIDFKFGYSVL